MRQLEQELARSEAEAGEAKASLGALQAAEAAVRAPMLRETLLASEAIPNLIGVPPGS